jgi:hypothetical protein
MNYIKSTILIAITLILLSNCKTYNIANYETNDPIIDKLPLMEVYIDKSGINKQLASFKNTDMSGRPLYLENFKSIIKHELLNNMCNNINSEYTFRVTITDYDHKWTIVPGTLFNTFTLGIGAIFGVPMRTDQVELTMRCHILDKNLNPIAVYEATSYSKKHCAMYYGYPMKTLGQAVHNQAFSNAFNKIKQEIENDNKMSVLN